MEPKNRATIIFCITGLTFGGAEIQVVRTAIGLKRRGWQVSVLSLMEPQAFVEELERAGVPVDSLGIRGKSFDVRFWGRIIRIIKKRDPQVMVNFMFHADVLGRIVGRWLSVPIIVSSIRNESLEGRSRERIIRFLHRYTALTTTNSTLVAQSLIKRRVVSKNALKVIPNGIDIVQYEQDDDERHGLRKELGFKEGDFVWLAIGRVTPQKDYPTLLDAFSNHVQRCVNSRLIIIGDDKGNELEEMLDGHALNGPVRFLGTRRDVRRFMQASDAFVLSSRWEGLPNVVMEACASGLPVLATRVGGTPEIIKDNQNGHLVDPNDPDKMALMMDRISAMSPPDRRKMGQLGKDHVKSSFALDQVLDTWEVTLLNLLEANEHSK